MIKTKHAYLGTDLRQLLSKLNKETAQIRANFACLQNWSKNECIGMNVEIPHWVVDSQLQGHKLKASLISAYHQCSIITVSTFTEKIQPKNMTFLGSASCSMFRS